jgi:hypothetical protein
MRQRCASARPSDSAVALPPLTQHATRLPTKRSVMRRAAAMGAAPAPFRDDVPLNEQEPHRVVELVVSNEDEVVEQSGEHRLRQIE